MFRAALAMTALAGCASVAASDDDVVPPVLDSSCLAAVPVDPGGETTTWVIDTVQMPTSVDDSFDLGLNVDCDPEGRPDNALGRAVSIVYGFESTDINEEIARLIESSRLLHLLQVQTRSQVDAAGVGVTLLHGLDVDGDPGDNFDGAEQFAIDGERGRGSATGFVAGGRLSARGEQLPVAITLPGLDEVMVLPVHGTRIDASFSPGRLTGRAAGAVPVEAIDGVLVPFVHLTLTRAIERDCPAGACVQGSFGQDVLALFDVDGDGAMGLEELRDHPLVRSLLAPDVDLFDEEGALNPRTDGVNDSLSLGMGFSAVPAATLPAP